jgi:hypothetical protein
MLQCWPGNCEAERGAMLTLQMAGSFSEKLQESLFANKLGCMLTRRPIGPNSCKKKSPRVDCPDDRNPLGAPIPRRPSMYY